MNRTQLLAVLEVLIARARQYAIARNGEERDDVVDELEEELEAMRDAVEEFEPLPEVRMVTADNLREGMPVRVRHTGELRHVKGWTDTGEVYFTEGTWVRMYEVEQT